MSEEQAVWIKKMIVHILDSSVQMPVLSEEEHPLEDDIREFVKSHIERMLKSDNLKKAHFNSRPNPIKDICVYLGERPELFVEKSKELAERLYKILLENPDIPPADMVCGLVDIDHIPFLAVLKFNYKTSYIHYVHNQEKGRLNSIIKQKVTLPGDNQRLEEGILINLQDFSLQLIEKKYEINGERMYYLSQLYLDCLPGSSDREKVKMFKKATQTFGKEYFDEDFTKAAEIQKAVSESLDRNDAIHVDEIAQTVFRQSPELQKAYIEHVEQSGLEEKRIVLEEKVAERNFRKQKIKTDTGIEISLPIQYYQDENVMEVINHPDGSISILLKNIKTIINR